MTAVDVSVVRLSRIVDRRWFAYFFNSPVIRREIDAYRTGSTRARISRKNLGRVRIRIPPAAEQNRIVAKIEALFSELDKGVESLTIARAQLKIYRQALLKHAFGGKLTEQWRKDHADELESPEQLLARIREERAARCQRQLEDWKAEVAQWEADGKPGKKPRKPNAPKEMSDLDPEEAARLPEIPNGWQWTRLTRLAEVSGGLMKGRKPGGEEERELPYLRVANVQAGWLDLDEIKYIRVPHSQIAKYALASGDVLYIEGGDKDKVGRGAVWRNEIEGCVHQNHVFKARPVQDIAPDYLSTFSQTEVAKSYFFANARQTVNLASISLGVLSALPVPLCSRREQQELMLRLEAQLSQTDQLEQTITTALQQAEALRQSILRRAFEGKLVPQDPNDEPASELLAHIRAERAARAAQPQLKRGRRRVQAEA